MTVRIDWKKKLSDFLFQENEKALKVISHGNQTENENSADGRNEILFFFFGCVLLFHISDVNCHIVVLCTLDVKVIADY